MLEKNQYVFRLEKDLDGLGLKLKYSQKELEEKESEISKLDFREK